MSDQTWFARSERALFRGVGGEVLLADAGREDIDVLVGTAAHVWDLLEDPQTLVALVGVLAEIYEAESETIRADVGRLLGDLLRRGWVMEKGPSA